MTTLKERFEKQFPEWRNKNAQALHVLSFFRQEFLALAEECEDMKDKYEPAYGKDDQALVFGLAEAASLIRNRANEL